MCSFRRLVGLYLLLMVFSVPLYYILYLNVDYESIKVAETFLSISDNKSVCKIPKLNPFHKSIKQYIQDEPDSAKCHERYPPVFKLGLNSSVIRLENTKGFTNCCYKVISRKDEYGSDDGVTRSKKCFPLSGTVTDIPPEHEFIEIYCDIIKTFLRLNVGRSLSQLVDAFAFVPRHKATRRASGRDTLVSKDNKLNLVIFGLDGVSHMNLLRIMPKVHQFLIQNLSAVSMDGYVRVGDNTHPNVLAFLASMKGDDAKKLYENSSSYDQFPFLWKNFSAEGYRTAFAEDSPKYAIFNYLKKGFKRPPTDYYLRPLALVLDKELGFCRRGDNICYGPRLAIEVLLNYMQKLAVAMNQENQRYFQFTWATSLTHRYLNEGKLGEKATLETLKWFHEENRLNQTVLVFMSDHGIRHGGFRRTKQGRIEENLPFLYFVFPQWFQSKYSLAVDNLMMNRNRLTSPFDLHETFLDILNTTGLETSLLKEKEERLNMQRLKGTIPRGISMFLLSPLERTCAMAAIPEHYCACHETQDLSPKSSLAQQAATFAVFHLNSLVSEHIQCALLSLRNVTNGFMFNMDPKPNDTSAVEQVIKVSFETLPGNAGFEGTLLRAVRQNETDKWSVSDISRVNLYGNQSHCVADNVMKKYCYCRDLL